MENKRPTSSKELRKMAQALREEAEKIRQVKLIKCAKYVVGLTALAHLKRKVRSL